MKPLIYVVDDEQDLLDVFTSLLSDNYEVIAFNNPQKFIAQFTGDSVRIPNLVITDFMMPTTTGVQMIKEVTGLGHRFPTILLSGYLDKKAVVNAVETGIYKILEKPTNFKILKSTISEVLAEQDLHRIRTEMVDVMKQLRELYSSIQFIMENYIPGDVLERLIVETDADGKVQEKKSFEKTLSILEEKFNQMITTEQMLKKLREGQAGKT